MSRHAPKLEGQGEAKAQDDYSSIVLVGAFDPRLFHPLWMARHGMLDDDEALGAVINVVSEDVAGFEVGPVAFDLTRARFQVASPDTTQVDRLRDLAITVLRQLPDRPVDAIGINRHLHFECASDEAWHKVGDALAPKAPWGDVLPTPGMMSITMQSPRVDGRTGQIQVQVEPSRRIPLPRRGVYIGINDHVQLKNGPDETPEAVDALDCLVAVWEDARTRSDEIIAQIMKIT